MTEKMRKANLLLLSIVFTVFLLPTVLAAIEGEILNVIGNNSALEFSLTTHQITINPGIGENVTYTTVINVTGPDGFYNITSFDFYLPDNSTIETAADYVLRNSTNDQKTATSFNAGNYNYVSFTDLSTYLNNSVNATTFNITFILDQPIGSTKLSESRSGREYTATWNITSSATNLTIENASLVVTPSYWYTRIGAPTSVQFNSTTKTYSYNITSIEVYTDLNISSGTGNLIEYGSGNGILEIKYNGPTIDKSSGKSPSAIPPVSVIPEEISVWLTPKGLFFGIVIGLVFIAAIVAIIVVIVKRK